MTNKIKKSSDILMLTMADFLGWGVQPNGSNVEMAFSTTSSSIDVTMTKQQAKTLGERLLAASK